jgi:hypothetical protein
VRVFHNKSRSGKTRVWQIEVDGKHIRTASGDLGGTMTPSTDEGQEKNVGRANYVSAEQNAQDLAERRIKSKLRGGYVEQGSGDQIIELSSLTELDLRKPLPLQLRFYKPVNALSKALLDLLERGEAVLTRKRDGEMVPIVKDENGVCHIFSRNMLETPHHEDTPWVARFEHIMDEVESDSRIPNGSIMLGDLVGTPEDDNRWYVAKVIKSKTDRANELQNQQGPLFFYCWDIPLWGGDDLMEETPGTRFELIKETFGDSEFLLPIETFELHELATHATDMSPVEVAKAYAIERGWEGWVVVDPDGNYGDRAYNFRGKADRPGQFCGKLKPSYEDDFVAYWDPDNGMGTYGRGKNIGQVGSVSLFQYDSDGARHYICDCGGGLIKTDAFRAEYTNPDQFPIVVQVEYESRGYLSRDDKSNALQFPRVIAIRDDKTPEECENHEL